MSLAALFHSADPARCKEFNLVMQAVGIDSEVVNSDDRYYLVVDEDIATEAYTQLVVCRRKCARRNSFTAAKTNFKGVCRSVFLRIDIANNWRAKKHKCTESSLAI